MSLTIDTAQVAAVVVLGMVAGTLGGMLGVGGSTVMIPGLTVIFGYNQHLYQAAAMVANVAVSVPAALRHYRAGSMTGGALRWLLPLALIFVIVGVWLSNQSLFQGTAGGLWLGRLLAVFLVYIIALNIRRFIKPRSSAASLTKVHTVSASGPAIAGPVLGARPLARRGAFVGAVMGLIAGLLGIGGGAVAVPLQQVVMRLPLRACIANSSAVICVSATMGAAYKNASLNAHGYDWRDSVVIALLLGPSCWLGGHLGAGLTHRLPVRQVRFVFVCLMILAAVKMAAIF